MRHTAIEVNYLDIYQRSGADRSNPLPAGIGVEGVGVIDALGSGVTGFSVGDRVAYVGSLAGAYGDRRNIPATRLVKLPDWIADDVAVASIFKGLTAEYLIHRCVPMQAGQWVLFHAAAGGVGALASQWLRAIPAAYGHCGGFFDYPGHEARKFTLWVLGIMSYIVPLMISHDEGRKRNPLTRETPRGRP